ncbi:sensor histidine kinase [Larkinella sp. GY13]|uniref:sensor histidine kinase n=1 Tax=Larkinella sp. GY13 TaxID=3453720 RepID=UPI003EEEE38B
MSSHRFLEWTKRSYGQYPVLFHVAGWLLYMTLPYLTFSLPQFLNQRTFWQLFGIKVINEVLVISFFYVNYRKLMPDALNGRRPYLVALSMLVMAALLIAVNAAYYRYFLQADFGQIAARIIQAQISMIQTRSWLSVPFPMIATSLLSLVLLTSVSIAFAIYQDRQQREKAHQQIIIEKKEAELSALKLQISPHFLFNTLNNLRWLARQKSDSTEEAIQRLSDMLRYMIYQVDRGPVALAREIDYLTDYIQLLQMRLDTHNRVVFDLQVDDDKVRIEPLLLIHFVENAFKYGMHHEQDSTVMIKLEMKAGLLTFSTRNQVYELKRPANVSDSGVGIQNVERRLALHYANRHKLSISRRNGLFCVDLQIDLAIISDEVADYSH